MATKTITIDLEAYNRLKKNKTDNESFSEVMKRLIRPPFDLDAWLRTVRKNAISPEAAAAVEEHIASRRRRSNRER